MAKKTVTRATRKRAEKPVSDEIRRAAARAGLTLIDPAKMLAGELHGMHAELGEVLEHVIGSRLTGEFEHENFEDALVKLRGVRIWLEDTVRKLCRKPDASVTVTS